MNLFDPQLLVDAQGQATPVSAPGPDHVAVLMAVHNGARWLPDQLASLAGQKHRDWSLIVGDDRSSDDSANLIHDFAVENPTTSVRIYPGPNTGFQANFLSLLSRVPASASYVAFADQDDVWRSGKLAAGVMALSGLPEGTPAIHCGRTEIADADLVTLGHSPRFRRAPAFANALVQSLAGGNTMMLNRAAYELLVQAMDATAPPVSHDWWAYQVVTGAGGQVVFDDTPHVIYRQHGGNLVGAGIGTQAKLKRLRRLAAGDFRAFSTKNIAALDACRNVLTPDSRRRLDAFAAGRTGGLAARFSAMRRAGIYRQTLAGTLALWASVMFGKI